MLLTLTISLIIVFIMLVIVGAIFDIFSTYIGNIYGTVTITVGIIALISFTVTMLYGSNPTAMDVYQGKTTLEITYRNGVAIDSTVVFKEK